jgi:hypothetical protein
MTVAELEGTNLEESAVIDHAIKTLSQGATVRVNIPAPVEGEDGSRSMVQLFDNRRFLARMSAIPSPTWSDFINR